MVDERSVILTASMWFIALLVAGFAILLNRSLKERVDTLERHIQELNRRLQGQQAQQPAVQPVVQPAQAAQPSMQQPYAPVVAPVMAQTQTPTTMPVVVQQPVVMAPPAGDAVIEWFKENWLLKLGALLLLIGFGWLVSYAFLNNWIGPMGRIMFGFGGGVFIMGIGFWRIRTFPSQGSVFLVLGATVILLTMYAARSIYGFFSPEIALSFMFLTSAVVGLASSFYNQKQLAIMSVLLAGIAPLLTRSPVPDYVALFGYLLVVIIGAVWLTWWKDYREVVLAALIVVGCYSIPVLSKVVVADLSVLIYFAYTFAAIFFLVHTAGMERLKDNEAQTDIITALGNAFLLAIWIYVAAPAALQSFVFVIWGIVFFMGAFTVYRITGARVPLALYAGIAIAYIAAATAIHFDGAALTLAYICEATVFSVGLYIATKDVRSGLRGALTLVGPVILSVGSIASNAWNTNIFNEHFFVLAALSCSFYFLAALYWAPARRAQSPDAIQGDWILFIFGTFYLYILLWLSFDMPQVTIVYTVLGVAIALLLYLASARVETALSGAALLIIPSVLSLQSIVSRAWQTGVIHTDFVVLLGLAAAFSVIGGVCTDRARVEGKPEAEQWGHGYTVAGSLFAYVLLWLAAHAALPGNPDLAVMISLFVYTVIGVATYIIGGTHAERGLRIYGGTLLAFVVGRLLLVDVWQMALTGRIITFFIIGTLLMSTAFFAKKVSAEPDVKA